MTTPQKLKKECDRLGANLDLERWDITAPEGHIFNASGCHYIVFEPWKEDNSPRFGSTSRGWSPTEKRAAYADALACGRNRNLERNSLSQLCCTRSFLLPSRNEKIICTRRCGHSHCRRGYHRWTG